MLLAIFQHALYDPTAILVGRQFLNVTSEGVDDELDMFSGYSLESFLNHMVSILILDALENAVLKFPNQLRLLVGQNVFQSLRRLARSASKNPSETNLLHYTATVHLAGECYDVTFHLVCQASFLGLVAVLEELLYHIVTEDIGHKLYGVRHQFSIDLVFFIAICRLKLSLNETSTILVAAKLHDMMVNVLWPVSRGAPSLPGID